MAKDGFLLTYHCNQVDFETSDQIIALPFVFLLDEAIGNGVVELKPASENGGGYILSKWFNGHVQSERRWQARDSTQYHSFQDLVWHTIDERQLIILGFRSNTRSLSPTIEANRKKDCWWRKPPSSLFFSYRMF